MGQGLGTMGALYKHMTNKGRREASCEGFGSGPSFFVELADHFFYEDFFPFHLFQSSGDEGFCFFVSGDEYFFQGINPALDLFQFPGHDDDGPGDGGVFGEQAKGTDGAVPGFVVGRGGSRRGYG